MLATAHTVTMSVDDVSGRRLQWNRPRMHCLCASFHSVVFDTPAWPSEGTVPCRRVVIPAKQHVQPDCCPANSLSRTRSRRTYTHLVKGEYMYTSGASSWRRAIIVPSSVLGRWGSRDAPSEFLYLRRAGQYACEGCSAAVPKTFSANNGRCDPFVVLETTDEVTLSGL